MFIRPSAMRMEWSRRGRMVSAQVLIDLLCYCVLRTGTVRLLYWTGGADERVTQVQNQAQRRAITQQESLSGLTPSYTFSLKFHKKRERESGHQQIVLN